MTWSHFFHEFGHLMHHILGGQQQWAGVSGISMEQDFAEALVVSWRSGCAARRCWRRLRETTGQGR